MDEQPLEIKIQMAADKATMAFKQLNTSIMKSGAAIETVTAKVNEFNDVIGYTKVTKSLDGTKVVTQQLNSDMKTLKTTIKDNVKETTSLSQIMKSAFDVNRLYLYWNVTKRLRTALWGVLQASIDYIETQNKFNVSMGSAQPEAVKYVNKTTEAVGIATTELMNYMSTYKNILSGLGNFTDREAEKITESLVNMALDYSSLFNVTTEQANSKFQAALTGSIRPIRSDSGFDVSELTIGSKAKELGVTRSVSQLNQMEKRILRIIVLMDQMKNTSAFGDLARTIETPSNQLKVLTSQVQELGVWVGNVFIGTFGKVIPYVNAFVMTLKELAKLLAIFVGYQAEEGGIGDAFEVVEDGIGGVNSGLGSANDKAKELKKTLMGFDVLNVITTPKDSDAGGGGVGSIDPKILDALSDYDSLLSDVRMKATDIRDRIMEWLGFIKTSTGWIKKEGLTNFDKILDIVKATGLAFATWKLSKAGLSILEALGMKNVWTDKIAFATGITFGITGISLMWKGTEHLLNGDVDIFTLLETFLGTSAGAFGIVKILSSLKKTQNITTGNKVKIGFGLMLAIQSAEILMSGIKEEDLGKQIIGSLESGLAIGLLFWSKKGIKASLKNGIITAGITMALTMAINMANWAIKYRDEVKDWLYAGVEDLNILQNLNVILAAMHKGATEMINDFWVGVFAALTGNMDAKKMADSFKAITQTYRDAIQEIENTKGSKILELETNEALVESLSKLVDETGKVNKGNEELARTIMTQLNDALGTELELDGNIIKKQGEVITSRENLQIEILKTIELLKKEAETEALAEGYKESIKAKIEAKKNQEKALKELNLALKDYKNGVDGSKEKVKIWTEALESANETLDEASQAQIYYQNEMVKASTKEQEAMEKVASKSEEMSERISESSSEMVDNITKNNDVTVEDVRVTLEEINTTEEKYSPKIIAEFTKMSKKSRDEFMYYISLLPEETAGELLAVTQTTEGWTPNIAMAYTNLGEEGRKAFEAKMAQLKDGASAGVNDAKIAAETKLKTDFYNGVVAAAEEVKQRLQSKFNDLMRFDIQTTANVTASVSAFTNSTRKFADGGLPNMGELFVAREAGPELVGKIGNTNAVMNNNQIVQSVSQGVAAAVSSVLGSGLGTRDIRLIIDGREISTVVANRAARTANIFGTV